MTSANVTPVAPKSLSKFFSFPADKVFKLRGITGCCFTSGFTAKEKFAGLLPAYFLQQVWFISSWWDLRVDRFVVPSAIPNNSLSSPKVFRGGLLLHTVPSQMCNALLMCETSYAQKRKWKINCALC